MRRLDALESKIEATAVKRCVDELGVPSTKLGQEGYPDRIFWIPRGKPLLIEFKRPGEEPRPLQLHRHNQLRQLGYSVEVHDNVDAAVSAVRAALEAAQLSEDRSEVSAGACVRWPSFEAWIR